MQPDDPGTSDEGARADHRHQECGGFASVEESVQLGPSPAVALRKLIDLSLFGGSSYLRTTLFGILSTSLVESSFRLRFGCAQVSGGFEQVWIDVTVPIDAGLQNAPFCLVIEHNRDYYQNDFPLARLFLPSIGGLFSTTLAVPVTTPLWYGPYLMAEITVEGGTPFCQCFGGVVGEHVRHSTPVP